MRTRPLGASAHGVRRYRHLGVGAGISDDHRPGALLIRERLQDNDWPTRPEQPATQSTLTLGSAGIEGGIGVGVHGDRTGEFVDEYEIGDSRSRSRPRRRQRNGSLRTACCDLRGGLSADPLRVVRLQSALGERNRLCDDCTRSATEREEECDDGDYEPWRRSLVEDDVPPLVSLPIRRASSSSMLKKRSSGRELARARVGRATRRARARCALEHIRDHRVLVPRVPGVETERRRRVRAARGDRG